MHPSRHISLFLIATFASYVLLDEARAAQGLDASAPEALGQHVPTPDEARVVADLQSHYRFAGSPELGAQPARHDQADWTVVRSTVRHGDVLEFRLTSIYPSDQEGALQREVDSILRYRMDGNQWTLLAVQTEATRDVTPGNAGSATEPC